MPDKANIKPDTWKVVIGGAEAEFLASVSFGAVYSLHDITSQQTGADVLGSMVQGRGGALKFTVQESTVAVLQRALGLAAPGDALAVGAQLPTHLVLLHPADRADGDATQDITFYAVRFGSLQRESDGQGAALWVCDAMATRDANGKVLKLGA